MNCIKTYKNIIRLLLLLVFGVSGAKAQGVVADAVERDALLAFYNSTGGQNWVKPYRWRLTQINSYPDSIPYGVSVQNGDIESIALYSFMGLIGTLPSELNNLSELQYLIVQGNGLSGALPNLGSLVKLKTLDLSQTDFNGSIPSWIGNLTQLLTLDLSSNPNTATKLSGPIPTTISQLSSLSTLYLNYLDFSATASIPDTLASLDNLQFLSLQGTGLNPNSVNKGLSGLNDLRYINLSYNPFVETNGQLPDVLYNLPFIQQCYLNNVDFRQLSGKFNTLSSLTLLSISGNNYADTTRLKIIIDTLSQLASLKTLLLTSDHITALPSNIGTLTKVQDLYLSSNPLNPSLCKVLGDMPILKNLYVDNCNLHDLPSTLTNITTLETLYAPYNNLYPIPDSIQYIPNLKYLDLTSNNIGTLPNWFGDKKMKSLTKLVLRSNSITIPLPDSLARLTNLTYLDMSFNKMTGAVPPYFNGLTQLNQLSLNNNKIDSIPNLSALTNLQYLYLQHNKLAHNIPPYFTNTIAPKLVVNLSYNRFTGVAVSSIFTGTTTVYLDSNALHFEHILKLKPTSGYFSYALQDSVDQRKEFRAYVGMTTYLNASIDTQTIPGSKFQWFKYVNGNSDEIINAVPSETAYHLPVTITEANQYNRYYYKITNPGASGLTLVSRLQTLVITCNVVPTVDFTTTKYLCAMNFKPQVLYPDGCYTKSYAWNFGDSQTSIDKSPMHAYGSGGTYTASLKIIYSCGICRRDTTITRQVIYNPSSDVLRDSLVTVTTDIKANVIQSSASTFSDAWPLQHNTNADLQSGFFSGSDGVWRNDGTYVYQVARTQSASTAIATDGTYSMEQFNWQYADVNAIPHWIKGNTMTQYSPYSYELENKDVLGVYSAALYDYGGHLPSANGVNMRNREMAFTSFEFLDQNATGNWIFGTQPLPAYYTYDVVVGSNFIAVVQASLAELDQVQKVDVTSRRLFGNVFGRFKETSFIHDDEIVCMQAYPNNPKWSMIVLRRSPNAGLWRGSIKVKNTVVPMVNPDIDLTFAHSGISSLKINMEKTFRQDLLQLDSGKSYFVSAWVSVNNPYPAAPTLANNLGFDMIIKNKTGAVVSITSIQPSGKIIEGWQQVKGTFICPDKNARLEVKFKPGSTGTAWYDDLRLHPEKGNMKSYVYDLKDYRLRAILDEENFASFFYYDQEGNLHLTKKETEEGIKTISENVSSMANATN